MDYNISVVDDTHLQSPEQLTAKIEEFVEVAPKLSATVDQEMGDDECGTAVGAIIGQTNRLVECDTVLDGGSRLGNHVEEELAASESGVTLHMEETERDLQESNEEALVKTCPESSPESDPPADLHSSEETSDEENGTSAQQDIQTGSAVKAQSKLDGEVASTASKMDLYAKTHNDAPVESQASSEMSSLEHIVAPSTGDMVSASDIAGGFGKGGDEAGVKTQTAVNTAMNAPDVASEGPQISPVVARGNTTSHFEYDTEILKDFLSRNAANKATVFSRRESVSNRRDSDAVRQALASPQRAVEDKDIGSPASPQKADDTEMLDEPTLSISSSFKDILFGTKRLDTVSAMTDEDVGKADEAPAVRSPSRRSARQRRTPAVTGAVSVASQRNKISVRGAGGEHVILKKTEAQELALMTRSNTRRNKGGAVPVKEMLTKLIAERAAKIEEEAELTEEIEELSQKIRWAEQLCVYQEHSGVSDAAMAEIVEQELASEPGDSDLAPADEDTAAAAPTSSRIPKVASAEIMSQRKVATPRARRQRGLGARNGTPGKGLLAPALNLLPEDVLEEDNKEVQTEKEPQAPVVKQKPVRERRSRIAPPSKSVLGSAKQQQPPTLAKDSSKRAPSEEAEATGKAAKRHPEPISADSIEEPPALESKPAKVIKERKSRLATPRKVKLNVPPAITPTSVPSLPPTVPSLVPAGEGRENRMLMSPPKKMASPRKGVVDVLPAPTMGSLGGGEARKRGKGRLG